MRRERFPGSPEDHMMVTVAMLFLMAVVFVVCINIDTGKSGMTEVCETIKDNRGLDDIALDIISDGRVTTAELWKIRWARDAAEKREMYRKITIEVSK